MADGRFKSIHHVHHEHGLLTTWEKNHKPLITVESGSEVVIDNIGAFPKNLHRNITTEEIQKYNIQGFQDIEKLLGSPHVSAPVYINGAEPGDTLKVEILDLETADWGWTTALPGLGALHDEFPTAHIKTYDLPSGQDYAVFKKGIHIPRQPFYGTIGVAPAEDGGFNVLFPRNDTGGNFDCRYVGKGATLYLPVNVPGALFSVGDAHFAQGDGEICGTAIETTMKSRIRLTVEKGRPPLKSPHYQTAVNEVVKMHSVNGKGEYGVMATSTDEKTAARMALDGLMDWLVANKELIRIEAYMLLSVAGNLKVMHELGIPFSTVTASIPLGIFVDE
ncbi:hypothetical protein F5884DRAFT_249959 [Xylogone sp. PMI_703]|nr:hypothetical protein F5884DRAFT_249959 [Xylogone sp. PMI_703]